MLPICLSGESFIIIYLIYKLEDGLLNTLVGFKLVVSKVFNLKFLTKGVIFHHWGLTFIYHTLSYPLRCRVEADLCNAQTVHLFQTTNAWTLRPSSGSPKFLA